MRRFRQKSWQRTISVDGERVTIKTREKTYMGNLCGFNVDIDGKRFFRNVLTRDEAEDSAIRENGGTE